MKIISIIGIAVSVALIIGAFWMAVIFARQSEWLLAVLMILMAFVSLRNALVFGRVIRGMA